MRIRPVLIAVAAVCLLLATACASASAAPRGPAGGAATGSGKVSVLYAGSLINVMENSVGPAFTQATGFTYQGQGAGATELANEIKAQTLRGDVFISASPSIDAALEGPANGNWVSWYATFADSALVLAYNPRSAFAAALTTKPWYQVLTEPGIKIGRTDPLLDPKGQLTTATLQQASKTFHDPTLAATVEREAQVFPEEELVGRLEAGQLDAGFFYSVEATAAKLPFVGLGLPGQATFTVTVLNGGPNPAGGISFVHYLLGPQGRAKLAAAGLTLDPVAHLDGSRTAVPADLRTLMSG